MLPSKKVITEINIPSLGFTHLGPVKPLSPEAMEYIRNRSNLIVPTILADDCIFFLNIGTTSAIPGNAHACVVWSGDANFLSRNRDAALLQTRYFILDGEKPFLKLATGDNPDEFMIAFRTRHLTALRTEIVRAPLDFLRKSAPIKKAQIVLYPLISPTHFWTWGSGREETLEDDPWAFAVGDSAPKRVSEHISMAMGTFDEPTLLTVNISLDQFLSAPPPVPTINHSYESCAKAAYAGGHIVNLQSHRGLLKTVELTDLLTETHNKVCSFSIVIPYYKHFDLLKDCLESISKAISFAPNTVSEIEVILINDDPGINLTSALKSLSYLTQLNISIIENSENLGITTTLNTGIAAARYEWILFVDCDDVLSESCFESLVQAIKSHPETGYISTNMIDLVHETGKTLPRPRTENQEQLMNGMFAGHLKCIRKSALTILGLLDDAFEGCQDFEFALRYSLFGPILFSDAFAYQYSWHRNTQSVSRYHRNRITADKARAFYLWLQQMGPLPMKRDQRLNALKSASMRFHQIDVRQNDSDT